MASFELEVQQLRFAEVELPDFHPLAPGTDTVYGFLIRDREACILVDTGIGTGSDLIDRLYKPKRTELSAVLAEAGASLDEVTAVVNSHLHFDHCGNNSLFPGVPIFFQQAELEAAKAPHYTVSEWVEFEGANYVPVHGTHSISERVRLIATPGHTPGHQSILMDSQSGTEIVVAQAAYSAAEFQAFFDHESQALPAEPDSKLELLIQDNASWSREPYVTSLATLCGIHPARARFSHDTTVWERASGEQAMR